jgi:OmcA/MtrC family decaheme c-type cytochrome
MHSVLTNHRKELAAAVASALWLSASPSTWAQEALDWEASAHFQYNLLEAKAVPNGLGRYDVTVRFSVTDPLNGQQPWDLKTAPEFLQPAGVSRLAVALGWTTDDYQNTGSTGEALQPVPFGTGGAGAALPLSKDAVRGSVSLGGGVYAVTFPSLPVQATMTGVAVLEGHPAWKHVDALGAITWERVPVKNAYRYFPITVAAPVPRREIVDINKCKVCHDGEVHGDVAIPRLSLHGGNRTEELRVCAVCHNPNQTDIPYRTSGSEVPIDFKTMIHSIHAGDFKERPFSIVGFRGAVTDFSSIEFPGELRDCSLCHIDNGVKGTFELPLAKNVLGTTANTRSVPGGFVDVNPVNDLKITPTAAVCSSCHDKQEVIRHMIDKGARFNTSQADITSGRVRERCVECHGPGREKDVRRAHEVGGSGSDDH